MEFGISTASFYPLLTEDAISPIARLGAQVCEVFFEADCEYQPRYTDVIARRLEEYGVRAVSAHAFCASFENQLFSDYARRRSDALVMFERVLQAAVAIGAKSYTFHGDKRAEDLEDVDFSHYFRCFELLADMAGSYGIALGWENVSWCQSARPEFIRRVREGVRSPHLKFTLDIKQARRAGIPAQEYINVMGPDIVNLHLNDHNEKETCLLPGRGRVDYKALFSRLEGVGYRGNGIIEVYRGNYGKEEELGEALAFLRELEDGA